METRLRPSCPVVLIVGSGRPRRAKFINTSLPEDRQKSMQNGSVGRLVVSEPNMPRSVASGELSCAALVLKADQRAIVADALAQRSCFRMREVSHGFLRKLGRSPIR